MNKLRFIFWYIFNYYSESRLKNNLYGRFRVVYHEDDAISERMSYKVAKDYASIFGGKIIYYKNNE